MIETLCAWYEGYCPAGAALAERRVGALADATRIYYAKLLLDMRLKSEAEEAALANLQGLS